MTHVLHTRPHLPDALLQSLSQQDTATVHEAMGKRGAMTHTIKPLAPDLKVCGRALTVKCHPGDNLMLIKAAQLVRPGDVIVADMGPLLDNGPFGEVLAVECQGRGAAGLVVSGSVRDSEALVRMEFPVFSAGVSVFGTSKATAGTINHPVIVGGVMVKPGDVVLGDRDGVVVIPFEEAEPTLEAAQHRRTQEAQVMARLQAGESLFDIYGYQRIFDRLGITQEEFTA